MHLGGCPVRLRKQITAVCLLISILAANLYGFSNNFVITAKAATFDELNHPEVFLKQVNGDMQCTLVAATMLIRRASMLLGNPNWADITIEEVKKQAWVDKVGLKYTFTYEGITVSKAAFGNDPVNESIALLQQHPEGIVLYRQNRKPRSHAVLLTDYTNGIFYCADPADAVPYGRIPISEGLVQVNEADYYYYITSPSIPSPTFTINVENNADIDYIIDQIGINNDSVLNQGNLIENESVTNEGNGLNDEKLYDENSGDTESFAYEGNTFLTVTDISKYEIELSQTDYYYDGNEKKPAVTIPGLVENTDFAVAYFNNVKPGNAAVLITGKGTYSGFVIKSFEIREATIHDYFNEIKASISKQSIKVGKTAKIEVAIPEPLVLVNEFSSNDHNNEVKISYSSDNSKIAKISSKGKITGKKKGSTNINVTAELSDGSKRTFTLSIKVK